MMHDKDQIYPHYRRRRPRMTQPGEYKLGDWLHDASDILTDRTIVRSIIYKAKPQRRGVASGCSG